MAHGTRIEWTHRPGTKGEVWPVVTGCSPVSEGCRNCYAARNAATRLRHVQRHEGLAAMMGGVPKWTGEVRENRDLLLRPLGWREPRTVFVAPSGDLFHEGVRPAFQAAVWATMALAPAHTFLVLTKRPERMRAFLKADTTRDVVQVAAAAMVERNPHLKPVLERRGAWSWPLSNVWVGTSVSDQADAERFLSWLILTPAALHFVSLEPLVAPVDLRNVRINRMDQVVDFLAPWFRPDWFILGGESGPLERVRPMPMAAAEAMVQDIRAAGVPLFVKQLGHRLTLADPKGGDPAEWPEAFRIREWPKEGV